MRKKGLLMATAVMASMALMACGSGSSGTATTAADAGKTEAVATEKAEESKDAPTADEQKFSLKLAENHSKDNPVSVGVQKFADLVKDKTNGSVEIVVYLVKMRLLTRYRQEHWILPVLILLRFLQLLMRLVYLHFHTYSQVQSRNTKFWMERSDRESVTLLKSTI